MYDPPRPLRSLAARVLVVVLFPFVRGVFSPSRENRATFEDVTRVPAGAVGGTHASADEEDIGAKHVVTDVSSFRSTWCSPIGGRLASTRRRSREIGARAAPGPLSPVVVGGFVAAGAGTRVCTRSDTRSDTRACSNQPECWNEFSSVRVGVHAFADAVAVLAASPSGFARGSAKARANAGAAAASAWSRSGGTPDASVNVGGSLSADSSRCNADSDSRSVGSWLQK